MPCMRAAQRPRPRITYAGASAISCACHHFANESSRFQGADHLAGKDMNFAWSAFANVENSAVLLGIIFHHANREPRPNVNCVLRSWDGEATIGAHSGEPSEGNR